MSLIFNGTEVEKVIFNGVEVEKVIFNGVVVWENVPNVTTLYFENPEEITGLQLTFHKNNTDPIEVYMDGALLATVTDNLDPSITFSIPVAESTLKIVGGSFTISDTLIVGDEKGTLKEVTIGKNVTSLGGAFKNTQIRLLKIGPNCQISTGVCQGCSYLGAGLYIYSTIPQTTKADELSKSYVLNANKNTSIHVPAYLDTMTIARGVYGNYFNYISATTEAPVQFDI